MAYLPHRFKKDAVLTAAALNAMDAEIVRLGQVRASGGVSVHSGPGGLTIVGPTIPPSALSAVAATGGISAAPNADTLGQGNAVLRVRNGAALTNGPTVKVFSNFSEAVPAGTRIEVAPDGADYKLVGADCQP